MVRLGFDKGDLRLACVGGSGAVVFCVSGASEDGTGDTLVVVVGELA